MNEKLYWYKGTVTNTYDGDTTRIDLCLGFDFVRKNQKIRLSGIQAPELRGEFKEKGILSRDYLRSLIDGKEVYLNSLRDTTGKYGRYLGRIWFEQDGIWLCANDLMIQDGYATAY